jgi:hypothetical protein
MKWLLLRNVLDPELLRDERQKFNCRQSHPPALVRQQLVDRGLKRLCELRDANDLRTCG